jgi:hypothetical protein
MKLRQSMRVYVVLASAMLALMTSSTATASMILKGGTTRFTSGLDKVTTPGVAWGLLYSFKRSMIRSRRRRQRSSAWVRLPW